MYPSSSTTFEELSGGRGFTVAQALMLDWVQVHPKTTLLASPDGSGKECEPTHPGDTATLVVVLTLLLSSILALRASDPFFLFEGGMAWSEMRVCGCVVKIGDK